MQLTPVTKTQLAAAAVKPVGAVAAGPGVRPGVSIAPQRTNSEVPTSFTWTYTNSSGADRKLCIGDPSGWLSTLQSGTVVAATGFSYGYTAASLAVFLTRFTLSIGRIDLTATTAAQFNKDLINETGYMNNPDRDSLNSYILSARNNMALNALLLSIDLPNSMRFGIDSALFWTIADGETVGLTAYFNGIVG